MLGWRPLLHPGTGKEKFEEAAVSPGLICCVVPKVRERPKSSVNGKGVV